MPAGPSSRPPPSAPASRSSTARWSTSRSGPSARTSTRASRELQWITNGYLLSLASLILLGGSLGDRFGRRRIFVIGTVWFAVASLLCGLAPNPEVLIARPGPPGRRRRAAHPGQPGDDPGRVRPRGPRRRDRRLVGAGRRRRGDRAVRRRRAGRLRRLALDLPHQPAARGDHGLHRGQVRCPRPATRDASAHFDVAGAVLATAALGGDDVRPHRVGRDGGLAWPSRSGSLAAGGFVVVEAREREPMLPLGIFRDRTFSASNVMTLLVYGALGAVSFFVTIQLQTVSGYGALAAGAAFVPMTVVMLLLASRGGRLATRIGPRIPMTFGPLVIAAGVLLMLRIGRRRVLRARRAARGDGLRARALADGRAADRDRAGGGARRARRHRQRRQQRGRPRRRAAGGRGAAGRGRAARRRVRRPGRLRRRVPDGDDRSARCCSRSAAWSPG